MIPKIIAQLETDMSKRLDALKGELIKLRTGRAHPSLIEHVMIDYYGNATPLSQVSSITVSDPRTLTITPWEKQLLKVIEKAILSSDLGFNPMNDGNVIRLPMPLLTEERRKELVKVVKNEGEAARVSVRNLRRDANNAIRDLLKQKEISEDDERRAQDQIQKTTDKFIAEIDKVLQAKEQELMTI